VTLIIRYFINHFRDMTESAMLNLELVSFGVPTEAVQAELGDDESAADSNGNVNWVPLRMLRGRNLRKEVLSSDSRV
jgi:hypothetical protein